MGGGWSDYYNDHHYRLNRSEAFDFGADELLTDEDDGDGSELFCSFSDLLTDNTDEGNNDESKAFKL